MCRSRRELSNEHSIAKVGFGRAESEPGHVCLLSVYRSHRHPLSSPSSVQICTSVPQTRVCPTFRKKHVCVMQTMDGAVKGILSYTLFCKRLFATVCERRSALRNRRTAVLLEPNAEVIPASKYLYFHSSHIRGCEQKIHFPDLKLGEAETSPYSLHTCTFLGSRSLRSGNWWWGAGSRTSFFQCCLPILQGPPNLIEERFINAVHVLFHSLTCRICRFSPI